MAKKKKKRPEDPGPKGAPEWVVTFTDMISLLVTFFVLLMTFSSIEDYDRLRVDGFLTGTRGNIKQIGGQKAFILEYLQCRDPRLTRTPFFAKFDPAATWFDDLEPLRDVDRPFFLGPEWETAPNVSTLAS